MPLQPGDVLDGRYEITERLGMGGMGEVFKAVHTYLGAPRVIKVVNSQISGSTDARERFLREARAATRVTHQNVATLHDFASLPEDGAHYMVWEYIEGENLAQLLRASGTLSPRRAIKIAVQALRGLDAIHRAGIVHRDISPENLMINREDDNVKIIDLGVAKLDDPDGGSQTQTGIFVGKLRYASPEQLGFLHEGEKIDGRTDIYSLGVVLVEMLTGRPAHQAKSPHQYFMIHAQEPVQKSVELPEDMPGRAQLQRMLQKALARNRAERYGKANELADELEQAGRNLPLDENTPIPAEVDADETYRPRPKETDESITVPPVAQADETYLARPSDVSRLAPPPAPDAALHESPLVLPPEPAAPDESPLVPPPSPPAPALSPLVPPAGPVAPEVSPFVPPPPGDAAAPKTNVVLIAAGVVAAGLLLAAGATGIALWTSKYDSTGGAAVSRTVLRPRRAEPVTAQVTQTTASVAPATATETVAAPAVVRPAPVQAAAVRTKPTAAEPATPAPESAVGTYIDGGYDDETNERALESLRKEVKGVTAVSIDAGPMQTELVRAMQTSVPSLEVSSTSPVAIRFEGKLERLSFGRKRRAAQATVLKNGRVIFRYELPEMVYRLGLTPADAFAKVTRDAFAP